jgi:hypothetical protein
MQMEIGGLNELKTVKEVMNDSNREIRLLSSNATLDKLGKALDKRPLAIHFCGHGLKNSEVNVV